MARKPLLIIGALLLIGGGGAFAASGQLTEFLDSFRHCQAVAKMFHKKICLEDFSAPAPYEMAPPKDKADEQSRNIRKLRELIWDRGLAHKFGRGALRVSDREIEAYRAKMEQSQDESHEMNKKMVALVENLLAKNKYKAEDEKRMREMLARIKMAIKVYDEQKKHADSLPEGYKFVDRDARRSIASMVVNAWQRDKVLYESYGGKVVYGKSRPLPLDGYAAMLDYIRNEGQLKIFDPVYADVLKEFDDTVKSTYGEAPADYAHRYFEDPSVQLSTGNRAEAYQVLKTNLESIPTLGKAGGGDIKTNE